MVAFLRHNVFPLLLAISTIAHAGLIVWSHTSESLPKLIAPQRGRASVAMRGSIQATASAPEPKLVDVKSDKPPIPSEPTTVVHPGPQVPKWVNEIQWAEVVPAAMRMIAQVKPTAPEPPKKQEKPRERPPETASKPVEKKKEEVQKPSPADSQESPSSRASHGSDADELPRMLINPAPRYPPEALAAGIEGTVMLRTRVEEDGRVSAVSIHESSGYEVLDEAALAVVRYWRFLPARRGGRPMAYEVGVPVRFYIRYGRP